MRMLTCHYLVSKGICATASRFEIFFSSRESCSAHSDNLWIFLIHWEMSADKARRNTLFFFFFFCFILFLWNHCFVFVFFMFCIFHVLYFSRVHSLTKFFRFFAKVWQRTKTILGGEKKKKAYTHTCQSRGSLGNSK